MRNKIRTLIVDDEPDAVNFISSIINDYCPILEIVGVANSAVEGIKLINFKKPELVFLDVEMPNGSGFDLLSEFKQKTFEVIFITAFNHYALKAIKFSAVDYILKPINISEFINAVEKVSEKRDMKVNKDISYSALLENVKTSPPSKLAIPTFEGMEYLRADEIIRIEADRSYCNFFMLNGRKILVSRNLHEYQELLSDISFFRIHNSHLINLSHVKKFIRLDGGIVEMCDGSKIPISRGKKDPFLQQMKLLAR